MSSTNPKGVSFYISGILSLGIFVLLLGFSYLITEEIYFFTALGISILFFGISYFVILRVVDKFIYSKVKLIYKSISSMKIRKNTKMQISNSEDMLEEVKKQVVGWAQDQEKEMTKLIAQEEFRREFLGNLSHELKTPIFSIQGYILTLLEGGLEDPKINRDFLERAANGVDRITHIIEDLDAITKLESGKVQLNIKKTNIVQICEDVLDSLELKAKEKNIKLGFNKNYDRPIFVNCDEGRIAQVITNLVVNSINYGKEGGKTDIRFFDMEDKIMVEVADDGPGIAQEFLPRIFERFYRVDRSRARHQGGSGLGLAIVKHILEAHGETINVRSTEDVGSTFTFTLQSAK